MIKGGRVETRKKGLSAVFLLLVGFFLSSSPASAAYLYDSWSSAQKFEDTVNAPYNPTPGQDIVAAYQAYDAGYLYFRIDLAGVPSGTPPDYANTYGIYIDSKAGGTDSSDMYVPGTLSGIDFIISTDLKFDKFNRMIWDPEFQLWKVEEFKGSAGLKFQGTVNDGKMTLEWRVKDGEGEKYIGNSFTWSAATMLPGTESDKKTYDIAGPVVTPIPSAAWLLGSGIIGLIGLKRRKDRHGINIAGRA